MTHIESRSERIGCALSAVMMITTPDIPSKMIDIPYLIAFPPAQSELQSNPWLKNYRLPDYWNNEEKEAIKQLSDVDLQNFVKSLNIEPGNSNNVHVVGIYIKDVLALRISQQTQVNKFDNFVHVTENPNEVSQYSLANGFGAEYGFYAHNNLAGESFSKVLAGQNMIIIKSNGILNIFRVSEIFKFRAKEPNDPYSNLVQVNDNLKDLGESMTSLSVSKRLYSKNKTVLQTCIDGNGKDIPGKESWGRLFIVTDQSLTIGFSIVK
jgi:hypothetical protein